MPVTFGFVYVWCVRAVHRLRTTRLRAVVIHEMKYGVFVIFLPLLPPRGNQVNRAGDRKTRVTRRTLMHTLRTQLR